MNKSACVIIATFLQGGWKKARSGAGAEKSQAAAVSGGCPSTLQPPELLLSSSYLSSVVAGRCFVAVARQLAGFSPMCVHSVAVGDFIPLAVRSVTY